ncbi:MAG: SAM-dependent methyltransferase, partial [Acidimicrobiia bacterium]|nr:SAM-dependent methyltransferase [Acidimicrobiia bacterium]MDX2468279.1 SAM-dependent methyltransferase [Acidimicrobiia bacterium]
MSEPRLVIVGLGPAGLERLSAHSLALLEDPDRTVIVRTSQHPAAVELSVRRQVIACDDLYDSGAGFDEVYRSIADRVLESAAGTPTVYAVPGSAVVGERAVAVIREDAKEQGLSVELIPGESFLDLVYAEAGIDPIVRTVKIVDGRDLPDPLIFDAALIITQVDRPEVLAD